jgi:hypothetical protein
VALETKETSATCEILLGLVLFETYLISTDGVL